MPDLPKISGDDAVKAFCKAGFVHKRTNGSHSILIKSGHRHHLSIPCHSGKKLGKGLLNSLIKSAEMTVDEFRGYL